MMIWSGVCRFRLFCPLIENLLTGNYARVALISSGPVHGGAGHDHDAARVSDDMRVITPETPFAELPRKLKTQTQTVGVSKKNGSSVPRDSHPGTIGSQWKTIPRVDPVGERVNNVDLQKGISNGQAASADSAADTGSVGVHSTVLLARLRRTTGFHFSSGDRSATGLQRDFARVRNFNRESRNYTVGPDGKVTNGVVHFYLPGVKTEWQIVGNGGWH